MSRFYALPQDKLFQYSRFISTWQLTEAQFKETMHHVKYDAANAMASHIIEGNIELDTEYDIKRNGQQVGIQLYVLTPAELYDLISKEAKKLSQHFMSNQWIQNVAPKS